MTTILNIEKIRANFPLLHQKEHGLPLVYLDSANTTQKPQSVLQVMDHYYHHDNANIHRAVYALSERATQSFENARDKIKTFINAKHRHEIIFVKGTTEGINLIANTLSHCHIKTGDEIIISTMEHHTNIVPWQIACERTGAILKVIPITDSGELDLDAYEKLFTTRTRLVAVTHVSNVLGTINPVEKIIAIARSKNTAVPVLLDGAQALPHMPVDVQALDCDFYVFSSHKMYGPTGVGVVYGKEEWLHKMPPYQGGGSMIREVTFEKTTYNDLPYKFEAGTANIAGVIGLGAAVDYLKNIGMEKVAAYEHHLLQAATEQLQKMPGLRIIGTTPEKAAVISFVMEGIHPHDVGTVLDSCGIAVRVGHHCAMPLMARFDVPATIRASFGIYNTINEIDVLVEGLHKTKKLFLS
jgi:cysteine desulfurase/selenocysteine lyase